MLICPLCRAPLRPVERSLVCRQRHSFDLAREGYFNLLRSNHPGDTRQMLMSRRRFLDSGHYAPIARRLCELATSHLEKSPHAAGSARRSVVDVGCGEGYYLGRLQSCLAPIPEIDVQYLGVDSSRDACRLAAQRYQHISFAVSDLKDLIPVPDASVDVLLDIFAPRSAREFCRVLAGDGLLIVVIPQQHHLQELRTSFRLIGIESNKTENVVNRFQSSLQLINAEAIEYELSLLPEEVVDLVGMSPSRRHLTEPLLPAAHPMRVTVAVDLLTFRSEPSASQATAEGSTLP